MHIVQIIGIGMTATVLATLLRQQMPSFATLVSLFAGVLILLLLVRSISTALGTFQQLTAAANMSPMFLQTLIRILGIAYVVEFAADVARDAGETALGGRIELAGKIGIVLLALPIFKDVLDVIVHMIP
ncbi:stage III sporulation protein AD [Alicyclobacillus mali]|uniref:Stage III sporulation protein AD n=1 Tax=Alicyclobacillus mali (ex Roth et al. 2021) TaxID=1123961 RepID=A0ABS0F603_9BACL|nr:stage III sporulation protein AD [Alicyclobacillus mali (ex Roth et al. 2021)]MBF8378718.1 stage III sporulation protein AD [Alicyclobacillus mali (ex Roth et al. 2021)]MCL6487725.1 stage III sporulation protein AD [Alicyclobacillus mali (ex Roth et al. 2021)]